MAVRFNALGDKLTRTSGLPNGRSFTVCFWARREGDGAEAYEDPWVNDGGATDATTLEIDTGATEVYIYPGYGGTAVGLLGSVPTTNAWYFYYLIANSTGTVNADCLPVTEVVGAGHTSGGTNRTFAPTVMELGQYTRYSQSFAGSIAAFKWWPSVLTPAEIAQERWVYRPVKSGATLWAPLIVNSKDYSGNGNDWTEGGTLDWEDGPPVGWGASPLIVGGAGGGDVFVPPPYLPGLGFSAQQRMG